MFCSEHLFEKMLVEDNGSLSGLAVKTINNDKQVRGDDVRKVVVFWCYVPNERDSSILYTL